MFVRYVGIALAAGTATAVVCWFATTTFGTELGWLACAIGLSIGLAMRRWGKGGERSVRVAAVVLASITVIMGTRYLVVSGLADQRFARLHKDLTEPSEEDMIATIADEIAQERMRADLPIHWPEGMNYDDAMVQADYPSDLWAEAQKRWSGFTKGEQQLRTDKHQQKLIALANGLKQKLVSRDLAALYRVPSLGWPLAGLCVALGCTVIGYKD